MGGIDFFALDSNTFNAPAPLPDTRTGAFTRQWLEQRQAHLEQQKQHLLEASVRLHPDHPEEAEHLEELQARLEQLEEQKLDITKQLTADQEVMVDLAQLEWLTQGLIASWQQNKARGRVIYLHHPPYVTEATKCTRPRP